MISDRLKATILKTLQLDDWDIDDETLAYEVPGWDSLNHIAVLCAVEKTFRIRIQSTEAMKLQNIGELQMLVNKKISAS